MFKSVKPRVVLVLVAVVVLSTAAVPAVSAGTLAAPNESPAIANNAGAWSCSQHYVVRRGDTLSRIASRFGTTVNALMRCNNIWDPDLIYWGQTLCICGGYNPPPPPPPPPPRPWPNPKPCMQSCGQPCGQPCPPPKPPPCMGSCGQPCGQPCPAPQPPPPCGGQPCPPPSCGGARTSCGNCSDQRVQITSPANGARVSGWVTFRGNAVHENFDFYKLEYGAGSNPDTWSWFFGGEWPVWQGTLGALNVDNLAPGTYTIRLTVVDKTSNYPPPCQVTIVVC